MAKVEEGGLLVDEAGYLVGYKNRKTGADVIGFSNAIDASFFGASGDGAVDNTGPIQRALDYAKANRIGTVTLGSGIFNHSDIITVDSVILTGTSGTILHSTDTASIVYSAIIVTGANAGLRNVKTTMAYAGSRVGNRNETGVLVQAATNFVVSDCTIVGSPSVGIFVASSTGGTITGNRISDTKADGIHVTDNCSDISIYGNYTKNTGDDAIAVVSYQYNGGVCKDISIYGNTIDTSAARGITVIGGNNVSVTGNVMRGITAAAMWAMYDSGFGTYGASNVTFTGNVVDGASYLFRADGIAEYPTFNITFANNVGSNLSFQGFNVGGSGASARAGTYDISIYGNMFIGSGTSYGGYINSVGASIQNNVFKTFGLSGMTTSAYGTGGYLKIDGNHFDAVSTASSNTVIMAYNCGHDHLSITRNTHTTNGGTIYRFIAYNTASTPNVNAFVEGNYSDSGATNDLATAPRKFASMRQVERSNAPTTGTWGVGDIVWNTAVASGGNIGWVCTTAGTPGTWKTFGAISA